MPSHPSHRLPPSRRPFRLLLCLLAALLSLMASGCTDRLGSPGHAHVFTAAPGTAGPPACDVQEGATGATGERGSVRSVPPVPQDPAAAKAAARPAPRPGDGGAPPGAPAAPGTRDPLSVSCRWRI
ncbi:hypothetical protein [Streptomyces sp. NPDC047928]|uniref:hypothetical protein n=1 Tax=Streptomyces sp. NPDC047928 TaxID=3365492 RepID=UPI003712B64F